MGGGRRRGGGEAVTRLKKSRRRIVFSPLGGFTLGQRQFPGANLVKIYKNAYIVLIFN
jgi:hypothetical protein